MKKCTKCGEVKEFSEFHRSKPAVDGRHTQCKVCVNEKKQKFYIENKEKVKEKTSAYYYNNKQKRNEQARAYYNKNKEYCALLLKEWHKRNPSAYAEYGARRKAAKLAATPSWLTDEEVSRIQCYYQLSAMRNRNDDKEWHVDHIVPLQGKTVCGLHVPWNLRVIPAIENMKKGNRFDNA